MWMMRLTAVVAVLASSCIPTLDVSGCLEACKLDTSPCAALVEDCLDECANDIECSKDCTSVLSECVDAEANGTLECAYDCIEEAEEAL